MMTNHTVAQQLSEYAREMDRAGELFRARSYRAAAFAIARLERPLSDLLNEGGRAALENIPGIGLSMGYTIEMLLRTGEFRVLREPASPRRRLLSLPVVGPRLAEVLRERLGVATLEGLLQAGRSGRLTRYVGRKQLLGILEAVEARLDEERCPASLNEPSVQELLRFDGRYRTEGAQRTRAEDWNMTAKPANTALAHRLGMTNDWVVIEFERGDVSGQRTIVTESQGALIGQRVVRGREAECLAMLRSAAA